MGPGNTNTHPAYCSSDGWASACVIGPDLLPPLKNTRYHSNFLIQFSPHKNATSRNESDADRALEDRTLGSITAEEDAVLTLTLSHIVIRVY